jgi:hypothetical protein
LAHKWAAAIEDLEHTQHCATAFEAYFTGLSKSDGDFVLKRLLEFAKTDDVNADAILAVIGGLDGNPTLVGIIEQLVKKNKLYPAVLRRVITPLFIASLHSTTFLRLLKAIAGKSLENASIVIELMYWRQHSEKHLIGKKLAAFIWHVLQVPAEMTDDDYFYYDSVAADLTRTNKECGFILLEYLLKQADYSHAWNPLREDQHEYLDALLEIDHDRTLRTIIGVALNTPANRFQITWDLRTAINIKRDKDFLIKFERESPEQALVVCACIDGGQIEFWSIASEIIGRYDKEVKLKQELQEELTHSAYFIGKAYFGPESSYLKKRLTDIESILKDPSIPSSSRLWLEDIKLSFRKTIKHLKKKEADEEVEDMYRY